MSSVYCVTYVAGLDLASPLPLRERVGVRGSGLSIERNPSPGSHLRCDPTSPAGGEVRSCAISRFKQPGLETLIPSLRASAKQSIRAFSSEVGPVRVKKTRRNRELEPPFRFNRNGNGSRQQARQEWIASSLSLLAMSGHSFAISRPDKPEVFRQNSLPAHCKGRRECRAPNAPAASRAKNKKHTS
jgi:hypothetical protein